MVVKRKCFQDFKKGTPTCSRDSFKVFRGYTKSTPTCSRDNFEFTNGSKWNLSLGYAKEYSYLF